MKLNNKGFAISSVMYLILIMAILLISIILTLLGNRKIVLDKLKDEVKTQVYQDSENTEFNRLYKKLDYIESTGTQWININYTMTTNNLYIKTSVNFQSISAEQSILGIPAKFELYTTNTPDFRVWGSNGTNNIRAIEESFSMNTWYDIQAQYSSNTLGISVNSSTMKTASLSNITLTTTPIYIFAYNSSGQYPTRMKLRMLKLYDNEKLVRDFIPCYRKSDGEAGLYDTVTKQFYTNGGTGEFIKGPDIDFKNEYQELDYIQSSGTQWINTNYTMSTSNFNAELSVNYSNTNSEQAILGIDSKLEIYTTSTPELKIWGSGSTAKSIVAGTTSSNTWYNIKAQYLSNTLGIALNNGTMQTTSLSNMTLTANPITIFAYNPSGTYPCKAKLRFLRFYDDGKLIKNFIPCNRKSDNKGGLYDTVTKQFYTNAGTGDFVKGSVIN